MKTRKMILVTLGLIVTMTVFAQDRILSYYCQEQGAVGQVPKGCDRIATTVEFFDNGNIKLFDGTVWKYIRTSLDGVRHYRYVGTTGVQMPATQYQQLMISSDYSVMRINYLFGMMGMFTQMYSFWRLLGEGSQLAFDWMNGYE